MLFLNYLWNTSKHQLTKVLWNIINEIWSATWAFLVWICSYSMRVMYLLDFKHSLKNTVWQFKFLSLLFYHYYYYYFLHIKEIQTLFFALLDRLIWLQLVEG